MPLQQPKAGEQGGDASSSRSAASASVTRPEDQLESTRRMLHALAQVHADFIADGDQRALFQRLLSLLIELTHSERGFISEVEHPPQGSPSLQPLATLGWSAPLSELGAQVLPALTSGQPVLIPEPGSAFLALPFSFQHKVTGLVGLAGYPGGDDPTLFALLQPVLTTCATLLRVWRDAARRSADEQKLLAQQAQLQDLALVTAQSAERLRLALESAEDGIWDWDVRTGELTVNPRWLTMLGYEPTLKPNLEFWSNQLCHPEDLPEANRLLAEHMEGRTPMYELVHRLRHKDGHTLWVLGRAKVVERDEQGRPLRIVGTNVDISSRKQAEERLQAFLQAIPDMIFRLRSDGVCLAFKESLIDPPWMRADMFLGKNLFELVLPDQLKTHLRAALERVSKDSSLEIFEYPMELPFGVQQYEARVVPSGPGEAMAIVRNITMRKVLEDQRRRQREELEERVRQATRELEARQAQLIQSEKLASLGQMAASIAHEINNPVGYVSSNVSTLSVYTSVMRRLIELYMRAEEALGLDVPDAVAEVLEQARALREQERLEDILQDMDDLLSDSREGITRIREFIQDLKTFVREESGAAQQADLNKLLQVTLRMLRHELKHKCQVRLDFGPLPLLRCYPTQLNQVFMNLLLNASQAIELRGELHITTRREGNEVVVWIKDSGRGMTPETLGKLFTPFFTTKPPGQGTGLGLPICYAIISRHKGRIDVESELGKGTTFVVRLPLTEE